MLFEPFQAYGFNKAHAASYGMVAYYTAYMKANFPVEYMTALLTAESSDKDKVSAAVNECRRMKIRVLPPDINVSDIDFIIFKDKESSYNKAIRFGLSAVKNVGGVAIEAILSARKDGLFNSFSDLIGRVDGRKVNKKVLESLIKVGALGKFGGRAALLASMDKVREKMVKPKGNDNQPGLFAAGDVKENAGVEVISIENVVEFPDDELQTLERQLLGFSLSAKPINEIIGPLEYQSTHKIYEISAEEGYPDMVKVACVLTEVRVIVTKKSGAEMAFAKANDGTGVIDLVVFPKVFKETRDFWTEGQPLLITGRVDVRDDAPNLLVSSIETMASAGEKKDSEVFVKIPKNIDPRSLRKLKELFTNNLGDQTAYLVFEHSKRVRLPFKIAWNETLAKAIAETINPTYNN